MDDLFESLWAMYPRKVCKKPARLVWGRMSSAERLLAAEALPRHIKFWKTQDFGPNLEFLVHFRTWLYQERWTDELPEPKVNGKDWRETRTGVEQKGAELGLYPNDYEHWQWFRMAVMKAVA